MSFKMYVFSKLFLSTKIMNNVSNKHIFNTLCTNLHHVSFPSNLN
jgi:hypothetical protein